MSCCENGFALMDTLAALGHNWQGTSTWLRIWLFEQAAKRGREVTFQFTCTPLGDLRQDRRLLWLASSLCKWGGGTYSSGLLDDRIYITVKEQCWVLIKCMYPHIHMCIHAILVCICVYMSYSVWILYASICICIHVIPYTCYICACIYTYHTTYIHYVCVYTYILNKKQF